MEGHGGMPIIVSAETVPVLTYFVLDGSQIRSGIFVVPIVLASGWTGHCAQFAIPTRQIPHSQSHPWQYIILRALLAVMSQSP
jgi:hypothetical protein